MKRKLNPWAPSALCLSLSLLSQACGEPDKKAQELEEPRVLGVRVESSSGGAYLEAGELAELEVLIAGTEGPLETTLAYHLCSAVDSASGVPFCAGDPEIEGTQSGTAQTFSVTIPESGPEGPWTLLGVACPDSDPSFADDPLDWRCSEGEPALRFSLDLEVGGEQNENPDLSQAQVEIGEESALVEATWTPASCEDGVPVVNAGAKVDVAVHLGEGARENKEETGVEVLQVSHFSTRGVLERHFSILDAGEEPVTRLEWEAPEESGPAKFYVVVRDGRDGVSFLSFSACVE